MEVNSDKINFEIIFENFKRKLDVNTEDKLYVHFFEFCNLASISFDNAYKDLVNDPNLMHSFVCYLKGHEIKNETLNFKKHSDFGTVIIENRCLPHLECLIRNTILKTPNNWNHSVVCTQTEFESINKLCNTIHENIKVIPISISSFTQNTYNNMLLSKWFWDKLDSENLLIYQQDTFLFREGIENYCEYDYIGAPWLKQQTDNEYGVGNGGFSFRKKSKMIKCLDTINPKNLQLSSDTIYYMENCDLENPPEDVYFSKTLIDFKSGKVADRETASQFSEEREVSENPIGGHQYWLANCAEMFRLHEPFKMVDWSYFEGEANAHRGGWKALISHMLKNNVIKRDCGIPLIDVLEKYFVWDNNSVMTESWVGISHMTPNTPHYLQIADVDRLIENENFLKSLPMCKSLVVLSDYMKQYFTDKLKNICEVNIVSLKHPTNNDIKKFDVRKFYKNNNKKVILLGQQMRKISSIYLLNTKRKKWWMYGHPSKVLMVKRRNDEFKMNRVFPKANTVEMVNEKNHAKYDSIICENIIIMDFFDASANNAVVECISANIPFFTKKLPAIEEYLGKDYPMYFNNLSEVENIVDDDTKLNEIYTKTNLYMIDMNKSEISYETFCKNLLNTINY